MRSIFRIGTLIAGLVLAASTAQAIPLLDVTGSLSASDPTQLGRLSRNGIPQDWSGSELFPGVINPASSYHYKVYSVNVGLTPFIQISVDSISTNTFFSAYDTAYLPASMATNWLGDMGVSGNLFPPDPNFFQVIAPINHTLLIVVNQTSTTAGLGDPFHLLVEGFLDTEFTDPAPANVPEPTTVFLTATGLAWLASKRARARARR
jgi:hypothetical protein